MTSNRLFLGGHHIAEQVRGPAMDGQFGFQLCDAPASGDQFGVVAAGHAGHLPEIDQLLTSPGVDRLIADVEIVRDLSDGAPKSNEIKDLPAELCGVAAGHTSLPEVSRSLIVQ